MFDAKRPIDLKSTVPKRIDNLSRLNLPIAVRTCAYHPEWTCPALDGRNIATRHEPNAR